MSAPFRYISRSTTLVEVKWRRSSHSTAANNCLEAGLTGSGQLAVRDSKDPQGPALLFTPESWNGFVDSIRSGELPGLL
jgi:hypothetical protein